jgi:glutamyl-Q tRNA(Asp) synthetase
MMRVRFAPSPNGRLHLGHAYSALLNFDLARKRGGRFLVRIEDIDTTRCTPALARAALEDLAWLGLQSQEPVLFQSNHLSEYRDAQHRLSGEGLLYPCFCSRQDVVRAAGEGPRDPEGQPLYPGTCKALSEAERQDRLAANRPHAWRLDMSFALRRVPYPLTFREETEGGPVEADPEAWGDIVIARRDIGTSYHIAVVVDDVRQEITHVVRGRDLYLQTAIHRVLQELLEVPVPVYHHHRIIDDGTGRKLAKSAGDRSLASLRESGVTPAEIRVALGF